MFDYPARAEENRTIPKSKIYEFAEPGRGVRKRFVEEVEDIVWLYTLAPETINLPARPGVDEIKIFSITLKTDKVSGDVLRTIDKAIPSPLFFELRSGDVVKFTAAYKRPSDADTSKTVVDDYFETDWQPAGKPRLPLPLALDLGGLYGQMLQAHAGVPLRPGELLKAYVERVTQIRTREMECRRLETRLRREIQFNRKVAINSQLRERKAELDKLQK